MRRLTIVAFIVLAGAAGAAAAGPPDAAPAGSEAAARAVLEQWLAAQNHGDFDAYQRLYGTRFEGVRRSGAKEVRLDRAGWIADRARMFRNKMTVTAADVGVEPTAAGYRVRFRQTWASGRYKDTGTKELDLELDQGELRIVREELLESQKDLGIHGAGLLVWAAGKPDETSGALESAEKLAAALSTAIDFPRGFPTQLEGKVDGVRPGESVVALGVCTPAELAAVIDLFRELGTRVHARETSWRPKGDGTTCPVFVKNDDTGGGWKWSGLSASAPAPSGTLAVVALRREESERGDFAREYRENLFVATVKRRDGSLSKIASFKGHGDFADVDSLTADRDAVVLRERYVDAPCNGSDRHRFQVILRTVRFELSSGDLAERELGKKTVDKGRCSDDETRTYPK